MNLNELTLGQAKELAGLLNCKAVTSELRTHAFEKGKSYFIRSVTHHYLGTVTELTQLGVVLRGAVWVADDGRFHSLMRGEWDTGSEREPWPTETQVQVFFGGMLDASEWTKDIPTDVK